MSEEKKEPQKVKINLQVDNPSAERLANIIEEERKEKETKKPSLEELKENMIKSFGRRDLFEQATSPEMLKSIFENWVIDNDKKANGTPAGSAPLNERQMGIKSGQDLYTKPYASNEEMVRDLREKAHNGSKEAASYLDSLWELHGELKKQDIHKPEPAHNPNSQDSLNELNLVRKDGFLTPANPEDGDLGQLQKKWREERLKKMQEGAK